MSAKPPTPNLDWLKNAQEAGIPVEDYFGADNSATGQSHGGMTLPRPLSPSDPRVDEDWVETMGERKPHRALVHVIALADISAKLAAEVEEDDRVALPEFMGKLLHLCLAGADLKRGDIIRIAEAAYRNNGAFIFDGASMRCLEDEAHIDEYGYLPRDFLVGAEFGVRYWEGRVFHNRIVWIDMSRFLPELLRNLTVGSCPAMPESAPDVPYTWFAPPGAAPIYVVEPCADLGHDPPHSISTLVETLKSPHCVFEYDREESFAPGSENGLICYIAAP